MSSLAFSLSAPLGGGSGSTVTTAIVTVDHVRVGLSRLALQFRSAAPMEQPELRTNMEKFLASLLTPFNDLELALQQLLQLRGLYVAVDSALDDIGNLVGQDRGSLGDDDYRRYLFARIATNRSDGKRRSLIKIARLILNDSAAVIEVEALGNATVTVRILSATIADVLAGILVSFLREAPAAGVRLLLESSADTLPASFAFSLSTQAPGALTSTATSVVVLDTSTFPPLGSIVIDAGLAVAETVTYSITSSTVFHVSALAHNHTSGADVQLVEPSTGLGFGDSTEAGQPTLIPYNPTGTSGGTLADVRE